MKGKGKDRMKVLVGSPVGGCGGIATWTESLLQWASSAECGVDVRVVGMHNPHPGKGNGIGRFCSGLQAYLPFLKEFSRIAGEWHPDVVHINTSGSMGLLRDIAVMAICRRRGVPVVMELHNGTAPELRRRGGAGWRLLMAAVRMADCVAVLDSATAAALDSADGCRRKIVRVDNPFTGMVWKSALPEFDGRRFVYVGRLSRTKGVDMLIDVFGAMHGISLELYGPDEDGLAPVARKYGENMSYRGQVGREEAVGAMRGACLVLPSLTEAFPMVVLEAMSVGAPVLATSVGAVEEMLAAGGGESCGIVTAPSSARELAAGLRRISGDIWVSRVMGRNGRRRVGEHYGALRIFTRLSSLWTAMSNS